MSHALLLRLFLSPFFSVHVAIQYLKAYPANVGITHYLTNALRRMPTRDVEFYWPELCHLLVTRPTDSIALEGFILERAEESTHSAMLTFWFMQAALCDLAPVRLTSPHGFAVCQRVLLKCHEIIFSDPPPPSNSSPYASKSVGRPRSKSSLAKSISSLRSLIGGDKKLVPGHPGAAFVGMGVLLASTPGVRGLVETMGPVAIAQGRMETEGDDLGRRRLGIDAAEGADGPKPGNGGVERELGSSEREGDDDGDDASSSGSESPSHLRVDSASTDVRRPRSDRSEPPSPWPSTSSSPSFPPSSSRPPSATTPSLPIAPNLLRKNTVDPFEQLPQVLPSSSSPRRGVHRSKADSATINPSRSVPSFSLLRSESLKTSSNRPRSSIDSASNTSDSLLSLYSPSDQTKLLRSHYCRSEVRFLIALEDISNRLLVIPKPARVSALRAELTSLNHLLPAEVCMPTWCQADHGHEEGGETSSGSSLRARPDSGPFSKAHHRVVRISPGDSVVLNSAERAPYLIHVEVLDGDLDFNPSKRANRDLLKAIVTGEIKKKVSFGGKSLGSDRMAGLGAPMPDSLPPLVGVHSGLRTTPATEAVPRPVQPPEPYLFVTQPSSSSIRAEADLPPTEEVDLVEQIYGTSVSARDIDPDLDDRPVPDANPRNKDIDVAVWSRVTDAGDASRPQPTGSRSIYGAHLPSSDSPSSRNSLDPSLSSTPAFPRDPSTPPRTPKPSSTPSPSDSTDRPPPGRALTLNDYSERMRTAAVMLAQLHASSNLTAPTPTPGPSEATSSRKTWIPGGSWISSQFPLPTLAPASPTSSESASTPAAGPAARSRLPPAEAEAIRERIMAEMLSLEEERVERMAERVAGDVGAVRVGEEAGKAMEDESSVRRELNKADPSAAVFSESWAAKKARIRAASPWGHLATWDVLSVIVKTGADLRQEQLATQLIERFQNIWKEEGSACWVRYFRILITGDSSGLVETITDSVSVHSIKKAEYGRRLAKGASIAHVSLLDHFVNVYGEQSCPRFLKAQRNFIRSVAGYSVATYLLQIKDRHNGNILIDRDGHCIHIDFGFMLSNSPGNMGFEAAPFKLTMEYVDIMGGVGSPGFELFKQLFKEGFEAARKHSDEIITIVELMQYNSKLPCFLAFGDHTAQHLRDRFQLGLTQHAVNDHLDKLILNSIGSNWTKLYDSFQWYSQSVFA